jgi:hypothetical protein
MAIGSALRTLGHRIQRGIAQCAPRQNHQLDMQVSGHEAKDRVRAAQTTGITHRTLGFTPGNAPIQQREDHVFGAIGKQPQVDAGPGAERTAESATDQPRRKGFELLHRFKSGGSKATQRFLVGSAEEESTLGEYRILHGLVARPKAPIHNTDTLGRFAPSPVEILHTLIEEDAGGFVGESFPLSGDAFSRRHGVPR